MWFRRALTMGILMVCLAPTAELLAARASFEIPQNDVEAMVVGVQINGRRVSDFYVQVAGDGTDVLILPGDFVALGVERGGVRVEIGGREYVSLASLAPGLTFEVDRESGTLRISAAPELFEVEPVTARGPEPAEPEVPIEAPSEPALVTQAPIEAPTEPVPPVRVPRRGARGPRRCSRGAREARRGRARGRCPRSSRCRCHEGRTGLRGPQSADGQPGRG